MSDDVLDTFPRTAGPVLHMGRPSNGLIPNEDSALGKFVGDNTSRLAVACLVSPLPNLDGVGFRHSIGFG
jgi:hypothetical protein